MSFSYLCRQKLNVLKRIILPFILWALFISSVDAQVKEFRNAVDSGYNFLLYTPEGINDSSAVLPLILNLHGRSLSGNSLSKVRRYGVIDAIERNKVVVDAIVLSPQCPATEFWNPDKLANVLSYVRMHYPIDTQRVYVIGMSLGAYGTMDFTGNYPHLVTAAIAMCGGGKPEHAPALSSVPLWIMHGKSDRAVPYSESQKIIDAIKANGSDSMLRYDFYDHMGHGELARAFYAKEMYSWLFQFRKNEKADTLINNHSIPVSIFRIRAPRVAVHATDSTAVSPSRDVHVVARGDTLYAIARKHKTSIARLCEINGLSEKSILQIGQRIILK
jgi:pimeloyl-ACP methyl ester carboxylesterase